MNGFFDLVRIQNKPMKQEVEIQRTEEKVYSRFHVGFERRCDQDLTKRQSLRGFSFFENSRDFRDMAIRGKRANGTAKRSNPECRCQARQVAPQILRDATALRRLRPDGFKTARKGRCNKGGLVVVSPVDRLFAGSRSTCNFCNRRSLQAC